MKTCLFLIIVFILNTFEFASFSQQREKLILNQLDFSRFPTVDLYFTMIDRDNNPLNLSGIDFSKYILYHNNQLMNPTQFSSVMELKNKGESELFIAMVFDNSYSMKGRTELLELAANLFIDSLKAGDYVSLIDFGDDRSTTKISENKKPIYARQKIDFSNSKILLKKNTAFQKLTTNTYMYDALLYGLSSLNNTDALGKKAVILFSDGIDIGSISNKETSIEYAKVYDIPIYAIDLNNTENRTLKELATNSGGEYYFVKKPEDLAPLYQNILKLFKAQYRLSYTSPDNNINLNKYNITLAVKEKYELIATRSFNVDGENIGFYNLAYFEKIGKESIPNYLDYLSGFPNSKHSDMVKLKAGKYWKMRGDYPSALAVFNMILRNPMSLAYTPAMLEKADIYNSANKYKEAQLVFNQLLRGDLNSSLKAKTMFDLARSYSSEGNIGMAVNTYNTIAADFEGNELAAEAILQSAILNVQTGNLTAAIESFNKLLTTYSESKSVIYAQMELAKIFESTKEIENAITAYNRVMNESRDEDLRDEAAFRLANLLIHEKRNEESIRVLRGIINRNNSKQAVADAKYRLIMPLFAEGEILSAREIYDELSIDVQNNLMTEFSTVPFGIRGGGTGLINGAYLNKPFIPGVNPISILNLPELAEKFSAVGPIYNITSEAIGTVINIPVKQKWIEKGLVKFGETGIFLYENKSWHLVSKDFNSETISFNFTLKSEGIYALLVREPVVVRLFNIYFDLNKANIKKEAEVNLYQTIDDLKAQPDVLLEIAGHTDSIGTEEKNLELSIARANSVRDFMVRNGINGSRLIVRGFGESSPIVQNDSPENMQMNRRTEFTFIDTSAYVSLASSDKEIQYIVLLKNYNNIKEVYEQKRYYSQRGFDLIVFNDPSDPSGQYQLILGIYKSREIADENIKKFTTEFKSIDPVIFMR